MSEPNLISPLLDGFTLGNAVSNHDGIRCYPAWKDNSEKKYIVKIISIPASQVQLDALLLTRAYPEPSAAMEYFRELADQIDREANALKNLSRVEGFLSFEGWQVVPMEGRLGYKVYLLSSYRHALENYVRRNNMTHLGAVNLGIDICSALSAARRAGWIYADLKPSNIFISENKEYRIGDLGLMELSGLELADLPGKYHSPYTAPELADDMVCPNTTMDTYALGMILYQIFNNGQLPQVPHPTEDILPPPANADYEMAEIILKACAPDPKDRWEDPVRMGQSLVAYMQRNTVNDIPLTPPAAQPDDAMEETEFSQPCGEDALPVTQDDLTPDSKDPELSRQIEEMLAQAEGLICSDATEVPAVSDVAAPELAEADTQAASEEEIRELEEEQRLAEEAILAQEALLAAQNAAAEKEARKADAKAQKETRKKAKKEQATLDKQRRTAQAKRILKSLALILLLSSLLAGVYFFYTGYYVQMIHGLSVSGSEDTMTVKLDSDIQDDLLTVICTDTYGNTKHQPVQNGTAEFTNLLPDMLYNIRVEIAGFHQLKGSTTHEYVTPAETKIVSYTAATGPEDGTLLLNFTVDGPDSEEWRVICTAEGQEPMITTFTGHMVTVNGLSVGQTYTVSLEPATELYIPGSNTFTFTASSIVIAEDLKILSMESGNLTVSWNTPEGAVVDSWTVRCYNTDGYDQIVTTDETTVTFDNITYGVAYAVEVTAAGMTQSARTGITANPLTVTEILVDDSNPQQLSVSWNFEGNAPAGGWVILYTIDGNGKTQVVQCEDSKGIIEVRVPRATYDLTIQAADGSTVFNGAYSFTTPNASIYRNDYQKIFERYHSEFLFVDLLKTPAKENWTHRDVTKRDFTTTFASGDPISIHLYYMVDFYIYHENISLMYVIRDGEGNVISDLISMENRDWQDDMWNGPNYHYCCLDIPKIPAEPGSYNLSLYFNGMAVTSVDFTITE